MGPISPDSSAATSSLSSGSRCRRDVGRRRFCRCVGRVEPEPIGLEDPEKSSGIPVVEPLLGDIVELFAHYNRLKHARHGTDRKNLLGPYLQHGMPNPRLLRLWCGAEPVLIE